MSLVSQLLIELATAFDNLLQQSKEKERLATPPPVHHTPPPWSNGATKEEVISTVRRPQARSANPKRKQMEKLSSEASLHYAQVIADYFKERNGERVFPSEMTTLAISKNLNPKKLKAMFTGHFKRTGLIKMTGMYGPSGIYVWAADSFDMEKELAESNARFNQKYPKNPQQGG